MMGQIVLGDVDSIGATTKSSVNRVGPRAGCTEGMARLDATVSLALRFTYAMIALLVCVIVLQSGLVYAQSVSAKLGAEQTRTAEVRISCHGR